MTAYYNEFDPKAAAWLRQLIINGDIADGTVDERSIIEVEADDLKGFTQHHFFAGVGVWSYALRNAGWPDDRPVATASLPCQPFSAAGNQKGKEDERHLLPHFLELVGQCNFHTIFGEQVEAAIKHGWLDDLQTVMERESYTVGHCILGAHSVSKPHIRKRIYWVAHSDSEGLQGHGGFEQLDGEKRRQESARHVRQSDIGSRVGNTEHNGHDASAVKESDRASIFQGEERSHSTGEFKGASASGVVPTESIDWLYCRDEKYRPIKCGIKPLVDGIARGVVYSSDTVIEANASAEARTIRLKGYGNAIVAPVAEEFIRATMDVLSQAD